MVQKRPFDAEEMVEVSFKHPKQVGPSNQHVSFAESVFPDAASHIPVTSSAEFPRGPVGFETRVPGGISDSCWGTCGTSEHVQSEPYLHLPFEHEYFSLERPTRTLVRREDIYSILFEHPPHRDVPVGPDHQADVPEWGPGATSRLNASDAVKDEVDERWMGTCIIPMPKMELLSIYDNEEVGKGRTDCSCEDCGSVRCVRQHIVEAREELRKEIGHEKFVDLGFSYMGEQVADKWSAEEEQLFHEVVFNNPACLDKTFWDYLPIAFPSKTKKETVSYYFNVFMLRRRAEQNRNDLLNIDSDDDEWHGDDDNGMATREDDEDNVAESPVYQDDEACLANCHENELQDNDNYVSDATCAEDNVAEPPVYHNDNACLANCHEIDLQDNDEYASVETCAVNATADFAERNTDDDSKYDPSEMPQFNGLPSIIQPQDQTDWQERFDEEARDVSCTSCDTGVVASQETQVKIKNGDHCCRNYNGERNSCSQGYVLDPCDAKD